MKILSQHTGNTKIKIVDILSELTGNAAVNFQRISYKYLDEGKRYLLLNLKHVKKIDGLGIRFLEQFVTRGVHIRLFNVGLQIRWMLKTSGKEALFKIYNEADCSKAVSMFEKESLEEETNKARIKKRCYPRVDTFFQTDFKYHPGHNGVIIGMATIMNLSECGAFVGQITAVNMKNKEAIKQPEISEHELYDIKFSLNGHSRPIETKGECVREIKADGKYFAGIRFKDMKQDYKKMVRNYVFNICSN